MALETSADETLLVAILRGVSAQRVVEIGDVLYEAGFRTLEVPLNSPDPFASISSLAGHRSDWTVGAGTVLDTEDVRRTRDAGGRLVLSPNCDAAVIRRALELDLQVIPGIATATEAFHAIASGARQLKLFPASTYGPRHLSALRAVLPGGVRVFPVGGIGARDIAPWLEVGAAGFGFGSELFHPDYSIADIARRARQLVQALRDARAKTL
jgi:2-dehydro-3-deoxyphosphogalactonate aldolase